MPRRRAHGEGTIKRRKRKRRNGSTYTRFLAVITVGTDFQTKKQIRQYGPEHQTQREARDDLKMLIQQRDKGMLSSQSNATLRDYLDFWLEQVKPKQEGALSRGELSLRTYQGYQGDVRNHITPRIGNLRLGKVTPLDLQNWQNQLERDTSPSVARAASACLSSALSQAVYWYLIPRNPYRGVVRVQLSRKEASYWEPSEVQTFLEAEVTQAHPLYTAFYLAITLGLRMGELRGLKWSDIIWMKNPRTAEEEPYIHIQRSVSTDRNIPRFSLPKTKKSNRILPLASDVLQRLEAHRLEQAEQRRIGGAQWSDYGLIIADRFGLSPTSGYIRKQFYMLSEMLKLRRIVFHGLRHTAGSLWLETGKVSLASVSRMLGHSHLTTTERIYLHHFKERVAGARFTLAEMLKGRL